jgi:cytoskeletal protein CcmA (bactofilin family)
MSRHTPWTRRVAATGAAAAVSLTAGLGMGSNPASAAGPSPTAFDYGVFSASSSIEPSLSTSVTGDVYSNYAGVQTQNSTKVVNGNVDVAGGLTVAATSRVNGTVRTGGDLKVNNSGHITGNANAGGRVTVAPTADTTTRIAGNACGSSTRISVKEQVAGTVTQSPNCVTDLPKLTLPSFAYTPSQWPGPTAQAVAARSPEGSPTWSFTPVNGQWTGSCAEFTSMLDYNTAPRNSAQPLITLSGTYRITGTCDVALTGAQELWISGQTALIMDGGFTMTGQSKVVEKTGGSELFLISTGGGNLSMGNTSTLGGVRTFAYTAGAFSQTGSGEVTNGQVLANQVSLAAGRPWNSVRITPHGFTGAGISDTSVKPSLSCVSANSDGTMTAVWGFDNPSGAAVTIPAGARNSMSPAYTDGQPTAFAAGSNTAAWTTRYAAGTTPMWTLDGNSAAVTPGSPACAQAVVAMTGGSLMSQIWLGATLGTLFAGMWFFGMTRRGKGRPTA